jgi:molybdenum cofactor cytidylyltransferase
MKLNRALDVRAGSAIAFVGAGGKTGALFALAQELESPVVLSTTTHLGTWQAQGADQHVTAYSPSDIDRLDFNRYPIILVTGPADNHDRLTAPDAQLLAYLHARCKNRGITLLVEADGARQRSLKAPADYEPVIPPWVESVVVMAGMKGLDKPLTEEWVHRPEIFSELSGRTLSEPVRVEDAIKVLGDRKGGLKGIPAGAKRYLFLAQADDPFAQAQACRMAGALTGQYNRVLVGDLDHLYDSGPVFAAHSPVAGVVLAAGGSKRLGQTKQLLDWEGEPFISKIVKTGSESGLTPLVVVTGADKNFVTEAIGDLPARTVFNPDWEAGQAGSMKAGLDTLPEDCDAVIFLLGDQPQVSPLLIRQLMERFYRNRKPVTAPMINRQRGNPVLFSHETFDSLRQVTGDQGGRAVIRQFDVDWLPWVDDRALLDVDKGGELDWLWEAYYGVTNSKGSD